MDGSVVTWALGVGDMGFCGLTTYHPLTTTRKPGQYQEVVSNAQSQSHLGHVCPVGSILVHHPPQDNPRAIRLYSFKVKMSLASLGWWENTAQGQVVTVRIWKWVPVYSLFGRKAECGSKISAASAAHNLFPKHCSQSAWCRC